MTKLKKCKYKEVEYDCPCWFEGWLMGEAEYEFNHPKLNIKVRTHAKNSGTVMFN